MSPFRIVAEDSNSNKFILCAMLSKAKDSNEKRIYILDKTYMKGVDDIRPDFEKEIAYAQSTKLTSSIIDAYLPDKSQHGRRYDLYRLKKCIGSIRVTESVSYSNRTLFDCQKTAMEDYCVRNNLRIMRVL